MYVPLRDEMGDPPREHPRLARSCPGDDKDRRPLVQHGLPLRRVEALEQVDLAMRLELALLSGRGLDRWGRRLRRKSRRRLVEAEQIREQ